MIAQARTPRPSHAEEHVAELRAIAARVRLRLYACIGWRELRGDEETWHDRWEDAEARLRWRAEHPRGKELADSIATVEASLERARLSSRFAQLFALRPAELAILHGCLALALDPELAGAVAAMSGRAVPSEALLRTIFDLGVERVLTPESRLARWELVHEVELAPGEPRGLVIDPAVLDWFTGVFAVDSELVSIGRSLRAGEPLAGWPVDDIARRLREIWQQSPGLPVRVVVIGPPGTGRRSFAAAVAARVGLRMFALDADAIDDAAWSRTIRRAHRQAYLGEAAFALRGESLARRALPPVIAPFPLTFAIAEQRLPASDGVDLIVELPPLGIDDRLALWRAALPGWPCAELERVARTYRVTPGDIASVAARRPTNVEELTLAIRERGRTWLGELAQRLECSFGWDDLVLPDEVLEILQDFAFEARERGAIWDAPALRRLFPQGRGLIALWTGAPGTGKTMAAQVVAAELGLDLFRISLSEVVSKYVGETAKNLQRVLSRAEHMDVVLFFDEADALFGKRTEIKDAHDRYANTDTNHLLQAIEAYSGIAILASNKKTNVDPAFLRRLRYVVDFPRPDLARRQRLWSRLVEELCGPAAVRDHASRLDAAAAIDLTGAQIKHAILGALLAARRERQPLGGRYLIVGIERELLKEGRAMTDREKERIGRD